MTAATAARPGAAPAGGGASFANILASEWLKIRTVRSTFWTLISMFVLSTVISTLISLAAASSIAEDHAKGITDNGNNDVVLLGLAFAGQIAAFVLGVMTISAEYTTGMIRTSLTAVPRRTETLVAKAILLVVIVFVVGVATAFACFFGGNAMLATKHVEMSISDPGVLRAILGSGLYLAGLSLFGLALGYLLRHTAGAITIGLALIFVIGGLVGLIPGSIGEWLSKLMPGNAGSRITQISRYSGNSADKMLAPWTGFAVFCAEVLIVLIIGAVLFEKRDA